VTDTRVGGDGLARWSARPGWLAAHRNDPRVQFPGRLVASSPASPYGLYRTARSDRAVWTAVGLEPDGAVLGSQPVRMTLDRDSSQATGSVTVGLRAADGAVEPVLWRVTRDGRRVAAGRLRPGVRRSVRLPVPECVAGERCSVVHWALRTSGPAVETPLPVYGPPGPPRPVIMLVESTRISGNG
jgi:hypothetical protein